MAKALFVSIIGIPSALRDHRNTWPIAFKIVIFVMLIILLSFSPRMVTNPGLDEFIFFFLQNEKSLLRCSFSPAFYSKFSQCSGSEAKIYQSQRWVSWRGNLLCFSSSRGKIISFISRFACWTDFAHRFLLNFPHIRL